MGGCDGSINVLNPSNEGLAWIVNRLARGYNKAVTMDPIDKADNALIKKHLSRADYMTLVYLRALSKSIVDSGKGKPVFNNATPVFQYGRADNPIGYRDDDLEAPSPDGQGSWHDNMQKITVGLKGLITEADLVALMGLHGAGMNAKNNSGFSGAWGPATDYNKASNHFYKNLLGVGDPTLQMRQIPVES